MRLTNSTMLRWPSGLRQSVVDAAAVNRRSINSEILARLEASFPNPALAITHGHLLPCPCGAGVPDASWFSHGGAAEFHSVQCTCGRGVSDGSADGAALRWNALIRGQRGAAA